MQIYKISSFLYLFYFFAKRELVVSWIQQIFSCERDDFEAQLFLTADQDLVEKNENIYYL